MKISIISFIFLILFINIQDLKSQDRERYAKDSVKLEQVVVLGAKYPQPIKSIGKAVYVIDSETIEANKGKSLGQLLNDIPNIFVTGSYVPQGHNISVNVNGGRAKDTLILIDGIPFNNPSAIDAGLDLRMIDKENIESIEVLKDGLSTLYGINASASVINIKLKKNKKKIDASIGLDYGSYETRGANISLGFNDKKLRFFNTFNYKISDGLSAASNERSPTPFKKDGITKKNWHGLLEYTVNKQLSIEAFSMVNTLNTQYDGGAFIDADNALVSDNIWFGIKPKFTYDKGNIIVNAVYQTLLREFKSSFPSIAYGNSIQIDIINKHRFSENITLLSGLNSQSSEYKTENGISYGDTAVYLIDPYLSINYGKNKGLSVQGGIRYSHHSKYGNVFLYNINPSYLLQLDNSTLNFFTSYSTAYITPTSNQLYSTFGGNKDLNPERSQVVSLGVKYDVNKGIHIMATYYKRQEMDRIGYVNRKYINIEEERLSDVYELFVKRHWSKKIVVTASYSYLEGNKEELFYKLPSHKYGISLTYKPITSGQIGLKYNSIGDRKAREFSSSPPYATIVRDVASFHLFDLYIQKSFLTNHRMTLYGSINNIFDTNFVDDIGYTTLGRNYHIGLKFNY